MVIDEVRVINKKRMSATAADFSTKHCAWSMLERGRIENTPGQGLLICSHRESGSLYDRPIKSFLTKLLLQHFTISYWWSIELPPKKLSG